MTRRRGAIAALRAGEPVILPTDTVYGLCASADGAEPTERLYALKGRDAAAAVGAARRRRRDAARVRAGAARARRGDRARAPAGAVHADPAEPGAALPWLTGATPGRDRRPRARAPAAAARGRRARSAPSPRRARTCHGGPDPRALDEIPAELRERVGAVVDGGELPGHAVDGARPHRRRSRACSARAPAPAAEALARRRRRAPLTRSTIRPGTPGEEHSSCPSRRRPSSTSRTAGLADVDPDIAALLGKELERQRGQIELIASENFTWPSVLEARRLGADEQVRRGLPGQALLRRLRGRRRDRAARDRPREGAVRRRARERAAARGRADEHGGLRGRARSRATRSSRCASTTAAT